MSSSSNNRQWGGNLTALKEAMTALDSLRIKSGILALSFPEEYYFAERSLIELGVLNASRGTTAHRAFFELMDRIGYTFPQGRPNKKELAYAVSCITDAPFPWEAAQGEHYELDDNIADLPRWRLIYVVLERNLFPPALQPSAE